MISNEKNSTLQVFSINSLLLFFIGTFNEEKNSNLIFFIAQLVSGLKLWFLAIIKCLFVFL